MSKPKASSKVKELSDGELLQMLLDCAGDIIAIRDADRNLIFISDGEERVLGYAHGEIMALRDRWDELIHPEDIMGMKETYEDLFKHPRQQVIRYRHKRKSGGWVWLEQTRDPVLDESGNVKYVVLIARDITESVEAGDTQISRESNFRAVFNQIPSACICYNREGKILMFNAEAERLYGWTEAEALGKSVFELIAPAGEQQKTIDVIGQVFEGKSLRGIEWTDIRKDGSALKVISNLFPVYGALGEVLMCVTSNIDITGLKEAERDVADREAQYRSLLENIQDGVFLIQNGLMVYVNDSFASIIGYEPEEIIGRHFSDFVAPDDLDMVGKNYQARLRGEDVPREYEFDMAHKDGETYVTVNMNVGLVEFGGEIASTGTIKNVTAQRLSEKALRDSEERFRRLSEASMEGVVVHERGKIIDVNARFAAFLGYPESEIEGRSLLDFAALHSRETMQKNLIAGVNEPYEATFIKKDGGEFTAEIQGRLFPHGDKIVQITAVRDVSQFKSAIGELEKSESRFKAVSESLGEGIAIIALADRRVDYANRRMAELIGASVDELTGKSIRDPVIPGELGEALGRGVDKCVKGTPYAIEEKYRRADGAEIWAQIYVTRFGDESGSGTAALAVVADITKRKAYEDGLRASEEKFRGLSEEISDGVAIIVDWNIKWINQAFREILGYTRQEIEDKKIEVLFEGGEIDQVRNLIVAATLGTSIPLTRKIRAFTKDGRSIVLEFSAKRLRFENEDAVQIVIRDITVQFRANEELKKSEGRFRELLESSNAIPWEFDVAGDKFTYLGPQAESVIGYPVEYWTGRDFALSIINPDDRERISAESRAAAFKGQDHELEYRVYCADGRTIWLRNTVSVEMFKGEPKFMRGFMFEITESKRASLLETSLLNISEAAATSAAPGELIRRVRESIAPIMDVKNFYVALYDEKTGNYSFPFFADEYDTLEKFTDIDLSRSLTSFVRRRGEPIIADNRVHAMLKREGEADLIGTPSPLWLGAPLKTEKGTLGVMAVQSYTDERLYSEKDLEILVIVAGQVAQALERLSAKKALAESERRFQMLADNIPGVIYLCKNDERFTMLYVNDAIESLTGFRKEEFLSDKVCFADVFHPEDVAGIYRDVDDAIERKETYHLIYRVLNKNSECKWVEEFGAGVFEGDELLYLEGFIHDITDRALWAGKGDEAGASEEGGEDEKSNLAEESN